MGYKESQLDRVIDLLDEGIVFKNDKGNGVYKNQRQLFVLEYNFNNLYYPIESNIYNYFLKTNLEWRSEQITNHPLSSQISCLNHLFPIRLDKSEVLKIANKINNEIIDVLIIESDNYLPGYIQFISVIDINHLNNKSLLKISNSTSIDAVILGKHKDDRNILITFKWNYVERYKSVNSSTQNIRKQKYKKLIENSGQLMQKSNSYLYYIAPFYQLMRQTLWAEQIIANNNIEFLKADDFIQVHIIPSKNRELMKKIYPDSLKNMEESWRSCIRNQNKYVLLSPKTLMSDLDSNKYFKLIEYLERRYW